MMQKRLIENCPVDICGIGCIAISEQMKKWISPEVKEKPTVHIGNVVQLLKTQDGKNTI